MIAEYFHTWFCVWIVCRFEAKIGYTFRYIEQKLQKQCVIFDKIEIKKKAI